MQNASNNKQSQITTDPITTTVKLYCLVHGDDPNQRAFPLDVTKTTTVGNLKELVKEKKKNMLSDIDADKLTLWLVNIHMDGLVTLSPDFAITDYGRKLSPFDKIANVFLDEPAEEHLHIVAETPPVLKRSPSAPTLQHMTTSTDQVDKSLVNTSQNTPPSSNVPMNFVNSTPVRQTTASSLTSERHSSIDSLLRRELEGALHRDVPEFIEKFFGSRVVDPIVVENVQKMLTTYPANGAKEDYFYKPFIAIVKSISKESLYKILFHGNRPLDGDGADRKPDYVGIRRGLKISNYPLHWRMVELIGEQKVHASQDTNGTDIQLASYAREVFGAQPNRRFVLGFTICHTKMRLWLFDRAGGISSTMFDIQQETEKFVRVIAGLFNMNEMKLGYDPTIRKPTNDEMQNHDALGVIEIVRKGKPEQFVLVNVIFSRPVISGRATTVWKAFKKGETPKKYYAIKDSWRDFTREAEGEMLESVMNEMQFLYGNPLLVAKHYHHEDLKINGKRDDIFTNIRKKLGPNLIDPVDRVHSRIILSTYGEPISEFSNNRHLLQLLRDAIEGHHRLWKTNVLHRDISINNILIDDNGRGFIIDLDFAVNTKRTSSQSVHRTGTGPFMAIDVLWEKNHKYRHDIESFFYVLLWICSEFDGPGKRRKKAQKGEKRLSEMWKGKFEDIAFRKEGHMLRHFNLVLETFSKSFEELKDFVGEFRKLLFPADSTSSDIAYMDVMKLFEKALEVFGKPLPELDSVTRGVDRMQLRSKPTRRS